MRPQDRAAPAPYPGDGQSGDRRATLVAVAPVVLCLLLPLVQVGGLFYLYDPFAAYAIMTLGFPAVAGRPEIDRAVRFLVVALAISALSGFLRTGGEVRTVLIAVQVATYILCSYSIFLNIAAGRVHLGRFTKIVAGASVVLGVLFIAQGIGMRVAPIQTAFAYAGYLSLAGYDASFFENRILYSLERTGQFRATGTWDVATTAGGIGALGGIWLMMTSRGKLFMGAAMATIGFGLLLTGARHAWVLLAIIILAMTRHRLPLVRMLPLLLIALPFLQGTDQGPTQQEQITSAADQIGERIGRTFDRGLENSSLQLRYVVGTQRFLDGVALDPTIAIFGFGLGTQKSLYDTLHPSVYAIEQAEAHSWGFVSNSWLLSIRNLGLLGFAALIYMAVAVYRTPHPLAPYIGTFFVLIVAADNYAVEVPRALFLIMVTFMTAIAWMQRDAVRQADPARHPGAVPGRIA